MNFIRWKNKLARTLKMLCDNSEVFDDRPSFRFVIIKAIWKER